MTCTGSRLTIFFYSDVVYRGFIYIFIFMCVLSVLSYGTACSQDEWDDWCNGVSVVSRFFIVNVLEKFLFCCRVACVMVRRNENDCATTKKLKKKLKNAKRAFEWAFFSGLCFYVSDKWTRGVFVRRCRNILSF